jgi:hypothetical protein
MLSKSNSRDDWNNRSRRLTRERSRTLLHLFRGSKILLFACAAATTRQATAQSLPDSVVAQIRAGSRRVKLPTDSTAIDLVGSPLTPSIEVFVNGHGPYRFLIDLGSNVTILRKNVVQAARGRTLARRPRNDIVAIDSLRVGTALFEMVVGGAYDTLDVDGVLGYNILRALSFTLDYPARRFSLHRRRLGVPDNRTVLPYEVVGRMPFIRVSFGKDSLLANLDTGASEWFTLPPALRDSIRWSESPAPGPLVSNNQAGSTTVLIGRSLDSLSVGPLRLSAPPVYVNPDADTAWLGSASMRFARWTFDVVNERVEIVVTGGNKPPP